jgi:hypothetical protein
MRVKFGLTVALFRGEAKLAYDHSGRRCTIQGRGIDGRGASRANASGTVEATGGDTTLLMPEATALQAIKRNETGPTRRALLQAGIAAAGGLLLRFHMPFAAAATGAEAEVFAPNAFIRIDRQGKVTLVMPQVEMGQGVYTSIAMILAEELDAAFADVTPEHAPPNDALYGNPTFHFQVTGNSDSIRAFWMPLRKAGAGARAVLVQAAAKAWSVDPATCRAKNSQVLHDRSGRKLAYGALAGPAAALMAPKDPPLKAATGWRARPSTCLPSSRASWMRADSFDHWRSHGPTHRPAPGA